MDIRDWFAMQDLPHGKGRLPDEFSNRVSESKTLEVNVVIPLGDTHDGTWLEVDPRVVEGHYEQAEKDMLAYCHSNGYGALYNIRRSDHELTGESLGNVIGQPRQGIFSQKVKFTVYGDAFKLNNDRMSA